MNTPPLSVANSARAVAEKQRAAALLRVADETDPTSITDVISAACTAEGRPLLRITLRQLLLAQPGWGPDRAAKALKQTMSTLGIRTYDLRDVTISWLTDPRVGGKRFMSFCDALLPREHAPWPGFPFAPKPAPKQQTSTRA